MDQTAPRLLVDGNVALAAGAIQEERRTLAGATRPSSSREACASTIDCICERWQSGRYGDRTAVPPHSQANHSH
jgi:hypothetical protein